MREIDAESLAGVHEMVAKRVRAIERRMSMAPLMEAMRKNIEQTMTQLVPDILAKPEARVRRSTLNLEKSLAEWPDKVREAKERLDNQLDSARARTAALKAWSEALD